MQESSKKIVELITRYLSGTLDDQGVIELERWKSESPENLELFNMLTTPRLMDRILERTVLKKQIYAKIEKKIKSQVERKMNLRWLAAASVVLLVGLVSYFAFFSGSLNQSTSTSAQKFAEPADVNPAAFKATLILNDSSKIVLDSATNGKLAFQGNTVVSNKDSNLVYSPGGQSIETFFNFYNTNFYNTLSTARGETYAVVLSDGSKIWLNADTELRYPVSFYGKKERRVELSGEAYLEVAHNPTKPFKVITNGEEVTVYGTRFNISAYKNDSHTKTSLLEGKIEVSNRVGSSQTLLPGEVAIIDKGNKKLSVDKGNVEGSKSWVDGTFHFENADLETVLRQLARWYNVEYEYSGKAGIYKFRGDIERNIPLSVLLKNLDQMGQAKFKLDKKKIIVIP